jgi:hypothetical protein
MSVLPPKSDLTTEAIESFDVGVFEWSRSSSRKLSGNGVQRQLIKRASVARSPNISSFWCKSEGIILEQLKDIKSCTKKVLPPYLGSEKVISKPDARTQVPRTPFGPHLSSTLTFPSPSPARFLHHLPRNPGNVNGASHSIAPEYMHFLTSKFTIFILCPMKASSELSWTGPEAEDPGALRRAQRRSRIAKAAVYVLLPLLLFVFFVQLHGWPPCLGHRRPAKPKTIEERVQHILSHTPLIGNLPH